MCHRQRDSSQSTILFHYVIKDNYLLNDLLFLRFRAETNQHRHDVLRREEIKECLYLCESRENFQDP